MSESELEQARLSLERLVKATDAGNFDFEAKKPPSGFEYAAPPPSGRRFKPPSGRLNPDAAGGFEFEAKAASPPPLVEDDIAAGLKEVEAIGSSVSGNFMLLVEICVGGLTSPIGIAMILIFCALVATGAAGDSPDRFVAQAPSAREGRYYEQYEPRELQFEEFVDGEPGMSFFAR